MSLVAPPIRLSLSRAASPSLSRSMPAASASSWASKAASQEPYVMRLRASLAARPAPGGPMWSTRQLMASSTGRTWSTSSAEPPIMQTSSPLAAASGPPLTPQSTTVTPRGAASARNSKTVSARDRADDDHGGPRRRAGEHALGTLEHPTHLGVVEHRHEDDVASGGEGRGCRRHMAALPERRGGLVPKVAHRDGDAGREEGRGEPAPDVAEPDDPRARHRRTVVLGHWREPPGRRSTNPAGRIRPMK